jgi:ADP-ribose pyrophosphatase YjhB (NUDIX family)
MVNEPKYCSQCGQPVETRAINGVSRAVCAACDTVLYRNPLPIAAALVLNGRREVLLVKRAKAPHKGAWCLPMGFAELGETIAEAACRELKEETGIDGRVLRLLDADSYASDHYGDLLIVTFELAATGGTPCAADDAEAVRYFPIGQHPPLAFPSNEKALRVCTASHLEDWEMQDSFTTLQAHEDKAMLADTLVDLIEEHAEDIVQAWVKDVRSNRMTPAYAQLEPEPLWERVSLAVAQFRRWFKDRQAADEVEVFYHAIGRERHEQGFRLNEVIGALLLFKKHVGTFSRQRGPWEKPIELYRALEFDRLMAAFYEQAIYHVVRGYEGVPPARPQT